MQRSEIVAVRDIAGGDSDVGTPGIRAQPEGFEGALGLTLPAGWSA